MPMKCKNCGGDLQYENGMLTCQNCGSVFSAQEFFEDIEVYLCYLENDNAGRRTKDSAMAQEIYYLLEEKKIKAFYKRISAEEYSGNEASTVDELALLNSKLVLMIGTTKDNYDSLWERYADKLKGKKIIPIFSEMNAYDIPKEINALQALKYDNVGASADLVKGVLRVLGRQPETEQTYVDLNTKQNKKKIIIVAAAVAGVILLALVGIYIFNNAKIAEEKKALNEEEETTSVIEENTTEEVTDDEAALYDEAVAYIDEEKYADAIDILIGIPDYKDSGTLLKTCYSKYAGYYYDETSDLYFQMQYYDDNGSTKITSRNEDGNTCTISDTIEFEGKECKISYTDSEGNHGDCQITLNNSDIILKITNTEKVSDVFVPDNNINFLLSDKSDQPIQKSVTIDFLKQILKNETTIGDIKRQGYDISFDSVSSGFEMASENMYKFDNTDISLEASFYSEGNKDDDSVTVFVVYAPMSVVDPDRVGDIDDPYIDGEFVFYPNGSYSDGYGGLLSDNSRGIEKKEITDDTIVAFKLMTEQDKQYYEDDMSGLNNITSETQDDTSDQNQGGHDKPELWRVNTVVDITYIYSGPDGEVVGTIEGPQAVTIIEWWYDDYLYDTWGKLKSGLGWINLSEPGMEFVEYVEE